jgi:very-short-patch-repair endonuclease
LGANPRAKGLTTDDLETPDALDGPEYQQSALQIACHSKEPKILKRLKPDPAIDDLRELMAAAASFITTPETIAYLVSLGADVNDKSDGGSTASRARDQMWLIHSLDPSRDLKPEDLRRRLVEFVRDPNAKRREIDKATRRAESPFEKAVMERLVATGYKIEPQVQVGGYRIDIVVSDGVRQAALECDGDRFHGMDQIADDMARQAVLERAGWRFVRLRGTRFYRDPDSAMSWVTAELARLDVRPSAATPTDVNAETVAFREGVVRRVWEIMRGQEWLPPLN